MRAAYRGALLLLTLLLALAAFAVRLLWGGGRLPVRERALWLQRTCRVVLRRMGIQWQSSGEPPRGGLIVSNHLSYFDIVLFSAAVPCVFVSKSEVRSWPLVGLFAQLAGTVFIQRGDPASTARVAQQMSDLLAEDIAVLLFPEGTSTDGHAVRRFHSTLFAPAVEGRVPITAAAVGYSAPGLKEKDLCYYGDVHLAPHLLQMLAQRGITGWVRFATAPHIYAERTAAAQEMHTQVSEMRAGSGSVWF